MKSSSPFQTLPTHIVRSIVDYAFNTYEVSFDTDRSYAMSILHSCHRWRSAFIRRACATLWLITDENDAPMYRFPSWPDQLCQPFFQADCMVRTFKVICGGWSSIMSGDALQWVTLSEYAGAALCSAQSFIFCVFPSYSLDDPPKSEVASMVTNAGNFLQYTRSMAPNAHSVEINWANRLFESQHIEAATLLSGYVSSAVNKAKRVTFLEYGTAELSTQLDAKILDGITQLIYRYYNAHLWFTEVLKRNSHTLEHLNILCMPHTCVKDILITNAGVPIVYPSLQKLCLDLIPDYPMSAPFPEEMTDVSTIHFPALRELRVGGQYPFGSNLFTKRPNITMESLNLAITPMFFRQRELYQAIASSQFMRLKTVVIVNKCVEDDTSVIQFIKTTTEMSTTIYRFEFRGIINCRLLLESISTLPMSRSLRFLKIRDVEVGFSDVVLLLRHLPLLRTADLMLDSNTPSITDISQEDLANYIGKVTYPLNANFNMLCIGNIQPMETEYLARMVALLAIGCPRMSRCATGTQDDDLVNLEFKSLASTDSYLKYSERLSMVRISP